LYCILFYFGVATFHRTTLHRTTVKRQLFIGRVSVFLSRGFLNRILRHLIGLH